jgi:hypothetical protein
MFLLHADAKYIDVMERTLYNGLISGVSLDGTTFFYQNPLEATGLADKDQRSPWFGVACCPGNITRFMASVPGYIYAQRGDAVWVNLFVASSADIRLDNAHTLKIAQETRYPWDGAVKMTVNPDAAALLTIHVRIPGWARNQPVASDLYRFTDASAAPVTLKVNGRPVALKLDKGYALLTRTWRPGDTIELNLPMPVRRVAANDRVAADRGRVALERGPIVYAAEWPDNPKGQVRNLVLPDSAPLRAEFKPAMLKGVVVVRGKATALAYDAQGKIARTPEEFTAIPYYAWANRGRGQMMVWFPTGEAHARPQPYPTVASTAQVTVSGQNRRDPRTINDQEEPASSDDPASYFDWWPRKGTSEWVEYAFAKPATVSQCQVYWFDDTGRGEVRVPASWRLLYREGSEWKPVLAREPYGVEKDAYNRVAFEPVSTSGLRLEITMQPNWSAGIQQWRVK